MSYVAAGMAILALYQGYMGSQAAKFGALAKADEYDLITPLDNCESNSNTTNYWND